jgi:hypothetical protein
LHNFAHRILWINTYGFENARSQTTSNDLPYHTLHT